MIRVGHNPNTNMLPMFYYLPRNHPLLAWVTAEPAGHNAMLRDGRIDLAPISSFSYGQHWRDYAILPGLSVSTKGRVGSILLFSKVPLEALDGKRVALTVNSATSVNLTKILLERFYGVRPFYEAMAGGLEEMFARADAALLIADMALEEALKQPACHIFDLGEEWRKWTGCAMSFAVWAYPRDLILKRPREIVEVHRLLLRAKQQALSDMSAVVQSCVEMLGGAADFWFDYFAQFHYTLDEEIIAGLERYYALCFEQGLLPSRAQLNLWPGPLV
ncbi:chorismate dehydratase [Peptococcaceae bacterium CEB3]|nr:chorismate dehydratase [Peptococcaceae bacterium CEB3]